MNGIVRRSLQQRPLQTDEIKARPVLGPSKHAWAQLEYMYEMPIVLELSLDLGVVAVVLQAVPRCFQSQRTPRQEHPKLLSSIRKTCPRTPKDLKLQICSMRRRSECQRQQTPRLALERSGGTLSDVTLVEPNERRHWATGRTHGAWETKLLAVLLERAVHILCHECIWRLLIEHAPCGR